MTLSSQSIRDEFLSEEDLDLQNLSEAELMGTWNQWLLQAQSTNEEDRDSYSHGVFSPIEEGVQIREIHHHPGGELIQRGIDDLKSGKKSIESCLIQIGYPKLSRCGLFAGLSVALMPEAEIELYRLLQKEPGDAYAQYKALLRELVSFEHSISKLHSSNR